MLFTDIGSASNAGGLVDDLIHAFRGRRVGARAGTSLALFDTAAGAVDCALAVRGRLAAWNRDHRQDRAISPRFSVDHVKDDARDAVPDETWRRIASIGDFTAGGRVLISRSIYLEARSARSCAFIPHRPESLPDAAEPIECYEAISLAGRELTPRTASASLLESPVDGAQFRTGGVFPRSIAAWALVLFSGVVLFALNRPLSVLLTPMQALTFIFQLAGRSLFGTIGSERAAEIGGMWLPLIAPALATFHYAREGPPLAARWSIFWNGQSLLSLGTSGMRFADPESLAGAQRAGLLEWLRMFGAETSLRGVAQATVLAGCLVIASIAVAALRFAEPVKRGSETRPDK